MAERKSNSKKSPNTITGRRLRELAVEATKHLDEVLPGNPVGDDTGGTNKEEAAAQIVSAHGRSPRRDDADAKGTGGLGMASDSETKSVARPAARRTYRSKTGARARALVAHISPGAARTLANLLNHIGLDAQVADCGSDVKSVLGSTEWDIVFAQGTPMPYPGRKISLAALSHCTELGTPVVLLARRGERLVPEAAGGSAVGLLEWPFSAEKVIRVLSEAIPDHKFI